MCAELEEWREIPGYFGFEASSFGRVKNLKTGNIIAPIWHKKRRYSELRLWWSGKAHCAKHHRLVALAFIPNPDKKPQINHKDLDRRNNHPSNLEWCTNEENAAHYMASEKYKKQRDVENYPYYEKRARMIRRLFYDKKLKIKKIAEQLKIATKTVSLVVRYKSHANVK